MYVHFEQAFWWTVSIEHDSVVFMCSPLRSCIRGYLVRRRGNSILLVNRYVEPVVCCSFPILRRQSIGGGDETAKMHRSGELLTKVTAVGAV